MGCVSQAQPFFFCNVLIDKRTNTQATEFILHPQNFIFSPRNPPRGIGNREISRGGESYNHHITYNLSKMELPKIKCGNRMTQVLAIPFSSAFVLPGPLPSIALTLKAWRVAGD